MATDLLALIGTIAGAVIAAGGSSVLVFSQYQASQRKKQPVLVKATDWNEVISTQRHLLALVKDQIDALAPQVEDTNRYERVRRLRPVVDAWKDISDESVDSILGLREGRKAFRAYRSSLISLRHLKEFISLENRYHPQESEPSVFPGRFGRFAHRMMHPIRWIFRRDIESYARAVINPLSRMQKNLIEISYLQPDLLLRPKPASESEAKQ